MDLTKEQREKHDLEWAQQIGVTTIEMTKKLRWGTDTNFYWVFNNTEGVYYLRYYTYQKDSLDDDVYEFVGHAPQMHEIARELPDNIKDGFVNPPFEMDKKHISYAGRHPIEIRNKHYAEAYAQLYLKLKKAGLLEKEAQNA